VSEDRFRSVVDALAHWRTRDTRPLRGEVMPPCDCLGDEIYDVALAVVFRDLANAGSMVECIGRIQITIDSNRPQLAHIKTINREYQPEAHEAARRIEKMLAVLERWKEALLDHGARAFVEGRAA
jgi:hypothetical protein